MYVKQIMADTVDTVTPETRLSHAAQLMREKGRRFLPVVDAQGMLQGLFGQRELAAAEPSTVTSLSVGEINYLSSKLTVGQLMQHDPVCCSRETLVEDAGHMIRTHKVGALPVVDGKRLVGIVTEGAILDFLLDITGCHLHDSARIAVHLPDEAGALGNFLNQVTALNGYIATVVSPLSIDESGKRVVILRYRADNPAALDQQLRAKGYELLTEELP